MNREQMIAWAVIEGWEWTGRGTIGSDTWAWVGLKKGMHTLFVFGKDDGTAYYTNVQGGVPVITPEFIPQHALIRIADKLKVLAEERRI